MKKKLLLVIALALVMVLTLSAVALADTPIWNVDINSVSSVTVGQRLGNTYTSTDNTYSYKTYYWISKSYQVYDSTINSETLAVAGEQYKYELALQPKSGYYFPKDSNNHYTGTLYMNGSIYSNSNVLVNPSGTISIKSQWMTAVQPSTSSITYVKVTGFSMPEVGSSLDFSASAYHSTYSISSITWYDKTTNSGSLSSSYKVEAGHKYQYYVNVQANEGYEFPYIANSNGSGYHWQFFDGDAYLNSEYCGMTKDPGPYSVVLTSGSKRDMQIVGYYTATVAPGIDNIALTVTPPAIDAKPADTFNAVNKTNSIAVGPENISWDEKADAGYWRAISTEKFVQGVQYRVQMVVKPASGCFAGAENSSSRENTYTGSLTVNGSKPKAGTYDVYAVGEYYYADTRCLVVTYEFPALGTLPVITEQPKIIYDAKEGQSVSFSVSATGEGLHYQWYTGYDNSPKKIGTDSSVLTLSKVTKADNNTDYWCEVSNAAGAVKSLKGTLYVGDYVFPFTDVPSWQWYYKDVMNANKLGLIDGKTPTLFKPDDNMTYAEAIKLAACMHQVYHQGAVTLAPGNPWYQPFVDYARQNGIPWSYANYNADITRKDYVHIFYAALPGSDYTQINSVGMAQILDVGPSTFAANEILTFYNAGILAGYPDGTFGPDKNIQRSEVAAILSRMMDHNARVNVKL